MESVFNAGDYTALQLAVAAIVFPGKAKCKNDILSLFMLLVYQQCVVIGLV